MNTNPTEAGECYPWGRGGGKELRLIDNRLTASQTEFMTVALAKDVADFVRKQVNTGGCENPGQCVNDLLRSFRDQQNQRLAITPELEAWLLEAADKPSTPLTRADFKGIRKRVRARARRQRP